MTDPSDAFRHARIERLAAPEPNRALAAALHDLVDACVRTEVDADEIEAVTAEVRALHERLSVALVEQPRNLTAVLGGRVDDTGNPMVGRRNPIAPPLRLQRGEGVSVWSDVELGAAYEGPPGHVHGGIIGAMLDQVMGAVPFLSGYPGMTAYLNVTYRRPTPLGAPLRVEAEQTSREGWKTFVAGRVRGADGEVTAEAEALFVTPRGARGGDAVPPTESSAPEEGRAGS
ncbi:PaaI family thioesterase [Alteromonas gracilis]